MAALTCPDWIQRESLARLRQIARLAQSLDMPPLTPNKRARVMQQFADQQARRQQREIATLIGQIDGVERLDDGFVLHYTDGRYVRLMAVGEDADISLVTEPE